MSVWSRKGWVNCYYLCFCCPHCKSEQFCTSTVYQTLFISMCSQILYRPYASSTVPSSPSRLDDESVSSVSLSAEVVTGFGNANKVGTWNYAGVASMGPYQTTSVEDITEPRCQKSGAVLLSDSFRFRYVENTYFLHCDQCKGWARSLLAVEEGKVEGIRMGNGNSEVFQNNQEDVH